MTISLLGSETVQKSSGAALVGKVRYPDNLIERYVFEFPGLKAAQLSQGGNPWLAALLPLAVTIGEPLNISLPVDATLFANAQAIMDIWAQWDARYVPVTIDADIEDDPIETAGKTAQLFTCGVDSFFTLSRFETEEDGSIDDLVFVHGYDIPLQNRRAWQSAAAKVQDSAKSLQKNCVLMSSNLRETRWGYTRWTEFSHGAALIAAGLTLEREFARLIVPASWNDRALRPWGSHPQTDVLFSTSGTQVVHYGSRWGRFKRTAWIVDHPIKEIALKNLRVCSRDDLGGNCGACGKCLRTMSSLDLLGALDEAPTFPGRERMLARLSRTYLDESELILMASVRQNAILRERLDVVRAIDEGVQRTARLDRWLRLRLMRSVGLKLKEKVPRLWELLSPLRIVLKRILSKVTNPRGESSVG